MQPSPGSLLRGPIVLVTVTLVSVMGLAACGAGPTGTEPPPVSFPPVTSGPVASSPSVATPAVSAGPASPTPVDRVQTPPPTGSSQPAPTTTRAATPAPTHAPTSAPASSTPVASAAPTAAPGSPAASTEPSASPGAGASGSASPLPGDAGAAACSGSPENRDFFAAVSQGVSWPVYCAVLPDGWYLESGNYHLAGGGVLDVSYVGPNGASLVLREGAYCTADASTCWPRDQELGPAAYGDQSGTLVTLGPDEPTDGYAVYVNGGGSPPSWSATGTGLDQGTFVSIVTALHRVE